MFGLTSRCSGSDGIQFSSPIRGALFLLYCSSAACGGSVAAQADASSTDATVWYETGGCGGNDTGCGCGSPRPVYDAGETLASDLAAFDGAVPDGACPPLTFGVPWGSAPMVGATLLRGCTNTTLFVTSSCLGAPTGDGPSDFMVFDLQGNIIGVTQMSKGECVSTGAAPDYGCGAHACEVLCGCDTWGCKLEQDAATVTDGGAD